MKVQIALVVGSNGHAVAKEVDEDGPDWPFLLDMVGEFKGGKMIYPELSQSYLVNVEVEKPEVRCVDGVAAAIARGD